MGLVVKLRLRNLSLRTRRPPKKCKSGDKGLLTRKQKRHKFKKQKRHVGFAPCLQHMPQKREYHLRDVGHGQKLHHGLKEGNRRLGLRGARSPVVTLAPASSYVAQVSSPP